MSKICALLIALAICPVAACAGEDVPVDKLPKVVIEAIHTEYPDAKLLEAKLEKEEEVTFYAVDVVHQGIKMEIDVSPEGKVLAIDEDLKKQN